MRSPARLRTILSTVVPSPVHHETIERAWQLHQRRIRESWSSNLTSKFTSMQSAISLLKILSPSLYRQAVVGNMFQNSVQPSDPNTLEVAKMRERLVGIFPRETRVPVESWTRREGDVGREALEDIWDEKWKRPEKKVVGTKQKVVGVKKVEQKVEA